MKDRLALFLIFQRFVTKQFLSKSSSLDIMLCLTSKTFSNYVKLSFGLYLLRLKVQVCTRGLEMAKN